MPKKTYDQLGSASQQLIDAMILGSEAARIINFQHFDDERDVFVGHPDLMVDYLRKLYALDIQTQPPRYVNWHEEGRGIIANALVIREHFIDDPDRLKSLVELAAVLTNLPAPEPKTSRSR